MIELAANKKTYHELAMEEHGELSAGRMDTHSRICKEMHNVCKGAGAGACDDRAPCGMKACCIAYLRDYYLMSPERKQKCHECEKPCLGVRKYYADQI